jgi:hypothetical protein
MRDKPSRPLHRDLVVYCASPFSVIPSATRRFEWSAGFWTWGRQSSHLVPKSIDPSDVAWSLKIMHVKQKYMPVKTFGCVCSWQCPFVILHAEFHKWYLRVMVWLAVISVQPFLPGCSFRKRNCICCWIGVFWIQPTLDSVTCPCGDGNDPVGSIKYRGFLGQSRDHQVLKNDSVATFA